MATSVFLFPGQGSQSLNMMNSFSKFYGIKKTFEEASDTLKQDLWSMLQSGNNELINATKNTQPLMLTASVALWRSWIEKRGPLPDLLAGHSLGEYSALVAADAVSFEDAIKLVRLRAELMQEAVPEGVGAMAAILGLAEQVIIDICQRESTANYSVAAANFNSPEQTVIAGNSDAVFRAVEACKKAGAKRTIILPVSVPSHCILMESAAEVFSQALFKVNFMKPKIPVIHNADVQYHDKPEAIRKALTCQLYTPVRWTETIQLCIRKKTKYFIECGPGKVLTGLVKRITKSTSCHPLCDAIAFQSALEAER